MVRFIANGNFIKDDGVKVIPVARNGDIDPKVSQYEILFPSAFEGFKKNCKNNNVSLGYVLMYGHENAALITCKHNMKSDISMYDFIRGIKVLVNIKKVKRIAINLETLTDDVSSWAINEQLSEGLKGLHADINIYC